VPLSLLEGKIPSLMLGRKSRSMVMGGKKTPGTNTEPASQQWCPKQYPPSNLERQMLFLNHI